MSTRLALGLDCGLVLSLGCTPAGPVHTFQTEKQRKSQCLSPAVEGGHPAGHPEGPRRMTPGAAEGRVRAAPESGQKWGLEREAGQSVPDQRAGSLAPWVLRAGLSLGREAVGLNTPGLEWVP